MSGVFYTPCVYTRRQSSDIFQNDPFKTQSYNFHYAERPVYHVQHYQRKQPEAPPFKTYYYNAKFHRNQDAVPPASSAFAENRRRQFLQEFQRAPTPIRREVAQPRQPIANKTPAVVSNPPLLRSCCNREDYRGMRRGQSVTTIKQNNCAPPTGSRSASVSSFICRQQPNTNQSQSTFKFSPRRSASSCSGCAININIRGADSKTDVDKSVCIKIETDACLHNNTDKYRVYGKEHPQNTQRSVLTRTGSSESFVIDKRLSKFSMADVYATSWARKRSSEQDALLAKKLQVQQERERAEKQRQLELKREQEQARKREKERERLRAAERQRDQQRLRELEAERENQRLRELERETQRKREIERRYEEQVRQERLRRMPMRAMSMPSANAPPVIMTSHLYRPASCDRLPGMVPCQLHQPKLETTRAERLHRCTRNLATLRLPQELAAAARCLERRSSGTSNYNASVPGRGSNTSLQQVSATRLNERKLLNLQVNGVPVSSNQPIHARINNMPIRITTSRPTDEHLQFSVNRVRVANAPPMAAQGNRCNHSRSCSRNCSRSNSRSGLQEAAAIPCNVNINVYADNPPTMHF